jgi:Domain of unknown function (DUF4129)
LRGGSSRIPLGLTVLAVLVLVGVVAVASTGSTPTGTADGRPPADILLDTFFTLALLLFIPAAALFVYGLMQRKEIAREIASGRYRRAGIATYLVLAAAFSLAVYFRLNEGFDLRVGQDEVVDIGDTTERAPPEGDPSGENLYEPELAWIPVIAVLVLVATGIAAYMLAARRQRVEPEDGAVAEHVADTLEDSLDDLRAEPDPRRAVIAAFARLERALAASGLPRRPAETAEEYVARILVRLEVERVPVRTLTDLYATAKFSQHDVDDAMKDAAIAALAQIRDELREAAQRRREEQEQALRAAHEQAAVS